MNIHPFDTSHFERRGAVVIRAGETVRLNRDTSFASLKIEPGGRFDLAGWRAFIEDGDLANIFPPIG